MHLNADFFNRLVNSRKFACTQFSEVRIAPVPHIDPVPEARGWRQRASSCVPKRVTGPIRNREVRARATPIMTAMDITIHFSFLPHTSLGFEVRNDAGYGGMRWLAGT